MSQPVNDLAIVISRLDYGEKDRILTLLCKEQGKVRALAKGVRSQKSKLAGGIELFSETQVGLVKSRGDLFVLTSSRLKKHFENIAKDLDKTMFAYDALKLLDKITEDGQGQEFYPILLRTLSVLSTGSKEKEIVKLWFSLQVLSISGHAPNLKTDNQDQKLSQASNYSFDYDKQCFYANERGQFGPNDIKIIRLCATTSSPPNVVITDHKPEPVAKFVWLLLQQALLP